MTLFSGPAVPPDNQMGLAGLVFRSAIIDGVSREIPVVGKPKRLINIQFQTTCHPHANQMDFNLSVIRARKTENNISMVTKITKVVRLLLSGSNDNKWIKVNIAELPTTAHTLPFFACIRFNNQPRKKISSTLACTAKAISNNKEGAMAANRPVEFSPR